MFDHLLTLPDRHTPRQTFVLALALSCSCALAAGDPVDGTVRASAAAQPPVGAVSRAADLQDVGSLSQLLARLGRVPDQSGDGGACGGIVVHEWAQENLRVISLGDQVQLIAPLDPDADPR